jgi:hypothetical protein
MEFKIILNPKYTNGSKVGLELKPDNEVLKFLLSTIRLINYPKLICYQSLSETYGEEHVHIMNYAEMDWEDKAWAKNEKGSEMEEDEMFLVHDVMGKTIIKEELFDKILFDYGSKVLEVYESDTSLPSTWKNEMTTALEKLEGKIMKIYIVNKDLASPSDEVLVNFLESLRIEEFPIYIHELLENINFGTEMASFRFYYQMDWEDKTEFFKIFGRQILEDEIEIYLYDGKSNFSVIKKNDFFNIFYNYSLKLLEVYRLDKTLPTNWSESMEKELYRLKDKLVITPIKQYSLIKKILLGQETFPVNYYDDIVPFTFYSDECGKIRVNLSLKESQPLPDLVENKQTTYEELSKIGVDRLENLNSEDKKYEYRYIIVSGDCNKDFLIIFNFKEYRDYYSCRVFGVIEIK